MAFPESTMDWKTTIIFDLDDDRRAAIYRELAPSGSAIPVASLADLGSSWPASAWFFVYDDEALLAELQREFAKQGVFLPIVVYSEALEPSRVVAAIYGGAVNYVQWPCDAATVAASIGSVAELARRRCEHAAARLAARDRLSALSPRELDVARCVGAGMTSKEIGRELGISHRKVEIHRANALAKMGARNTAEASRLFADADGAAMPIVRAVA
jgi:two-component system, LuxR family, response regulator FixJ